MEPQDQPSSARQGPARHALFPGTFDPPTLGHIDLVERAVALFGRVTVGVAHNPAKASVFQSEERLELLREATKHLSQVEIVLVPGLVVHACEELGCDVIVRGVRSGTDFDYELQMGRTNEELSGIDTVLLIPAPGRAHISSTLVRQIAGLNGDVSNFVPKNVLTALRHRYPKTQPHS